MSNDLMPNEKYAETDEEEAKAEFNEARAREEQEEQGDSGYDSDRAYDEMRDDNSEELDNAVVNIINNLSTLPYYKHRSEGLAKDIFNAVLHHLNLKISDITQVCDYYDFNLTEKTKEQLKQNKKRENEQPKHS